MNLTVRIPDEHADRVRGADPARLERAALEGVLRAAEVGERDERAVPGHTPHLSPQEAAARLRAARHLPEGVSIRDLMVHGRA